MAQITVRIRGDAGTHRLDVSDTATLESFRDKIVGVTGIPSAAQKLSLDQGFGTLLANDLLTLKTLGVGHGSLVFVKDTRTESSSTAAGGTSTTRCNHPPQFTCLNCAPKTAAAEVPKRCVHGPFATCPNCMSETNTGSNISWLCNHPPTARCVNCGKKGKKKGKAEPARACTHPPSMKCSNCIGGAAAAKKDEAPLCNHPPTMRCPNCTEDDEDEAVGKPRRCRNHGPHGSCVECMSVTTSQMPQMKSQENSHCTYVSLDHNAAQDFQQYMQDIRFANQRCGHLYGTVGEDGSVQVQAIYEPPQDGTRTESQERDDPDASTVDAIAGLLGLRRVGYIMSRLAQEYPLNSREIRRIAGLQQSSGVPSFVTVTLTSEEGKSGATRFEAFQLSDQCLQMYRQGRFIESSDPANMATESPVIVEKKEVTSVSVAFFIIVVPIRAHQGTLSRKFPIENRRKPLAMSDLKIHMLQTTGQPFIDRISDFHLILFLRTTGFFDLKSDMPPLCEGVRLHNMERIQGFQDLIESLAQ